MTRKISFGEHRRLVLDRIIAWVRMNKILRYIPHNSAVLDMGCGFNADLLNSIFDRLKTGTGIDLSINPQFTGNGKITLLKGKVDKILPLKSNTYDVVTALAIIEHVDNPSVMLSEAYRVLKPGGILILTTPSLMGKVPLELMASLGLISKTEIADHKRYYTISTLKEELRKSGFKTESITVSPFGIFFLNIFGCSSK